MRYADIHLGPGAAAAAAAGVCRRECRRRRRRSYRRRLSSRRRRSVSTIVIFSLRHLQSARRVQESPIFRKVHIVYDLGVGTCLCLQCMLCPPIFQSYMFVIFHGVSIFKIVLTCCMRLKHSHRLARRRRRSRTSLLIMHIFKI